MSTGDRRPLVLRDLGWVRALAERLAQRGVSPNAISVWGVLCALAAGGAWAFTGAGGALERLLWLAGAALVVLRIFANTLDGLVAVECGKGSREGMLYNEAPDRIADSALLIGAGYAHGGIPELGYLAACIALFVSYVRILGRLAGAASDYSGPMDKGGRVLTLIAAAVYLGLSPQAWQPAWGPAGHWGIATLALGLIVLGGLYTAARRLRRAARQLRDTET
jgi:phosphatidylglycerophosphate synthase